MNKLKSFFLIAVLSMAVTSRSQSDIMYFMNETPQSSFINPAFGTKLGTYISLPVLPNLSFDFHTSGFSYHDIIHKHPLYQDSLQLDIQGFHGKLRKRNSFNFSSDINLLGFGFNAGKNHFSFDLTLTIDARIGLEKSLLGFIIYGTDSEDNGIIYNEPLADASVYLSPSVSFARQITNKLTIGARVGLLFGIADITAKDMDISMTNQNGNIMLRSNIDILFSTAFGGLQSNSFFNDKINWYDNASSSLNNALKNRGGVIDLGARYKINESMEVSAAVADIGFIKWRSNATRIHSRNPNQTIDFYGLKSTLDSLSNDLDDYLERLGDTLNSLFDLKTTNLGSYTSRIPTKFYLGYTWHFAPTSYLHALYKGVWGNGYLDNYLSLLYGFHWKCLAGSVGNTFTLHTLLNPSFMVSITGAGMNLYLGSSFSFSNPVLNVADMSGFKIFMGFNILIGRKPYWEHKLIPLPGIL
ncbi:MAG: DUF5723 family protein [Bacteroidales bacterium]|jgi:hypothetical protein|nr:DUF5723 family protein [Bacteroidales bacterium]